MPVAIAVAAYADYARKQRQRKQIKPDLQARAASTNMFKLLNVLSSMPSHSPNHGATPDEVLASFRQCLPIFHALGDKNRQDIIMLLTEHERLNVNDITARMALSRPAVSHHLKVLLQAGLVKVESASRENFYSLDLDAGLALLKTLVTQAETSCT